MNYTHPNFCIEPSNPTYLSTNVVNGNDVLLSWNPPSSPNGLLIDYQVIYTGHERTLVWLSVLVHKKMFYCFC